MRRAWNVARLAHGRFHAQAHASRCYNS